MTAAPACPGAGPGIDPSIDPSIPLGEPWSILRENPGVSPGGSRSGPGGCGLRWQRRVCEGRGRAGPGINRAGFCAFSVINRCLSGCRSLAVLSRGVCAAVGKKSLKWECGGRRDREADLTVLVNSKMRRMGREKMMPKSSRSA